MVASLGTFAKRYAVAMLRCAYLFSVGWVIPRHRRLINQLCAHFGHVPGAPRLRLPTVKLSDLVPAHTQATCCEAEFCEGNVTLRELICLASLARHFRPGNIFEIGTFDGRTTLNLAINAGPEAHVHTLDLPREMLNRTRHELHCNETGLVDKPECGVRFQNAEEAEQITQLLGDSADFDFTPYENRMDMVFVDGSHAYSYVVNDTHVARRLLRDGRGVIVWHDYADGPAAFTGVIKALHEFQESDPYYRNMRRIQGTSLVVLAHA